MYTKSIAHIKGQQMFQILSVIKKTLFYRQT